jgi:outer membrane protein insertion porin family
MKFIKFKIQLFCFIILTIFNSFAENLKEIRIEGNDRITDETIKNFLPTLIGDNITNQSLNLILKDLYETNFFKNVDVKYTNNILTINVSENPIIQNIIYNGIKSKTLLDSITNGTKLITRSSFIEQIFENDLSIIFDNLKDNGYYFATIDTRVEDLGDNIVNLIFDINLGNKAKIKKITFLGEKIFKDKKLKSIILSEEYKFWKFISGKKFLNNNLVNFDKRLLTNFYKNNGYYNVKVESSFAKLINNEEFELIFNIEAGDLVSFGELKIDIPLSYDVKNFDKMNKTLDDLEGKPYSINSIEKLTEEIDLLALSEQYETINIDVVEDFVGNKLNIDFIVSESEKILVKKINILGNNVTRENVIRNKFEIDEGDFYNEILMNKTINNLKALNFFKTVKSNSINDVDNNKIINIIVEEKATGEIGAAAGVGSSGGSFGFFVKENNYLGKGIGLEADLKLNSNSIDGKFSIINPNLNDTDKSLTTTIEATEIDRLKDFGYKTKKTGFLLATDFEFLDDFRFGLGNSSYLEKIETDSTASPLQKKQEGNYLDSFINLNFNYDKRNQKFKTSDGFRSFYGIDVPIVSETNTLTNTFNYSYYTDLYKDNITSFSFYLQSSNSLTGDDIKLTERNFLSSRYLRGFEPGRVGPKDGDDYIGGNYASALNINTTLPGLLEENQNVDFSIFFDAANIWGVDYSSTINESSKIRSSTGLALDWLTPIGPVNFSLALPISKVETDKTESFRFNLGTTF